MSHDNSPENVLERKGALKAANIPVDVLDLLSKGQIESVNLTEWLAVDHSKLIEHVWNEVELTDEADSLITQINALKEKKTMKIIPLVAHVLLRIFNEKREKDAKRLFEFFAAHRSDSVRCWAAYTIGINDDPVQDKLSNIQRFAADKHFGVREIAWMAVRESITDKLGEALDILEEWTWNQDENIRRFSVESIRPRGVWCKHIQQLKEKPELAVHLLNNLKSDDSKYVQDSVGNWLNDASKSNSQWVSDLCEKWEKESDTKHTKRIVIKATRTIINTAK
jgi:3-methyladenine DNA glycosylase AlkC